MSGFLNMIPESLFELSFIWVKSLTSIENRGGGFLQEKKNVIFCQFIIMICFFCLFC